jgi:hypothetical protein
MSNINTNLIKAIVKTQMEKYGDLLVNLYQKVKEGGALTTTDNEKKALYNLAENYSNLRGGNTPVNEIDFTNLVRNIKQNKPLQQMIQWGGSSIFNNGRSLTKASKRLQPLYLDYLLHYRSSQSSTVGRFN